MRQRGLFFAGLLVLVVGAVVAYVALRPGPVATPASPSPVTTATPVPTPSQTAAVPSPSPTPSASPSPSPVQGRFVNAEIGYSIDLPPPWRFSDCGSGRFGSGADLMVNDLFVTVSEYDMTVGETGIPHDHVSVFARPNAGGLTPRQWYESGRMGRSVADVLTEVTFAARPALRVAGGDSETYVVQHGDRMFEVGGHARTGENTAQQRAAVLSTFRFLSADELAAARAAPTPTPLPPRTPEEVADILAEAFAKKDVALLATVITPSCVSLGVNQGGGSAMDDRRYLDELADRFREGLVVEVRPRPIKGDRTGDLPTVMIESTWKDPRNPDLEQDLMISPEGERWYWRGNIAFLNGRP